MDIFTSKVWNTLKVLTFILATMNGSQTLAQTPAEPSFVEPVRNIELVDTNGVDLKSGSLTLRTESVSIGPIDSPVFSVSLQLTDPNNISGSLIPNIGNLVGYLTQAVCAPGGEQPCDLHLTATLNGRSVYFPDNYYVEPAGFVVDTGDTIRDEFQDGQWNIIVTDASGTSFVFAPTTQYGSEVTIRGRISKIIFSDGRALNYSYDNQNNLTHIESNLGYRYILRGSTLGMFNLAFSTCSTPTSCTTEQANTPNVSVVRTGRDVFISDSANRNYHTTYNLVSWSTLNTVYARTLTLPGGISLSADWTNYRIAGFCYAGNLPWTSSSSCGGGPTSSSRISRISGPNGIWNYNLVGNISGSQPFFYRSTSPLMAVTRIDGVIDGAVNTVITNPLNFSSSIAWRVNGYDESSFPAVIGQFSRTLPSGLRMENVFNAEGRITEVWTHPGALGGTSVKVASYGYVPTCTNPVTCGRPIWSRDSNNSQTDFTYDPVHGGILTETLPATPSGVRPQKRHEYQQFHAWIRDGLGGFVQVASPVWRLIRTSECRTLAQCAGSADEVVTEYAYGSPGTANNLLLTSTTVRSGDGSSARTVSQAYDEIGNIISSDGPEPGAADTTYSFYDSARRLTGTVGPDPDGTGPLPRLASRLTYNAMGRLANEEQGTVSGTNMTSFVAQQSAQALYDEWGRKIRDEVRGSGGALVSVTQYSYDAEGRLECSAVRMNLAAHSSLPSSACALGPVAANGDQDRITRNVYDAAGQLVQSRRAVGTALEQAYATYAYTANGHREAVIDANGNRATLEYDGFDRLTRWIFPSGTRPLSFNPATPATALATAGGVNPSDFERYDYDSNGNRTSLRRRDGSILNFQYDALNRMTVKLVPERVGLSPTHTRDVYYGYDLRGLQTYARFDSTLGEGVTNTWDGFGRQTSTTLSMDGQSRTLSFTRNANGLRTRLTWMDGLSTSYDYDRLNRLTAIYPTLDGSGWSAVAYNYNAQGQLESRVGRNGQYSYRTSINYDSVGRPTSLALDAAGSAWDLTIGLSYNAAGQIATSSRSSDAYVYSGNVPVSRAYAVNGLNQYLNAGSANFTYDANGNLTSDGSTTYHYDGENRLVESSGARTATLRYDPLGRLYETSGTGLANLPVTRYLYDGDELVAEFDPSGTVLRRYVHGISDDDPVQWYEGPTMARVRWLQSDQQGSIIAMVKETGIVGAVYRYDDWGVPDASNQGRFQYTGQAWLPELGMYYYKARIYSPTLGRFLQTDPIGYEDQVNLYAYVGNDPANGRDPTGQRIVYLGDSQEEQTQHREAVERAASTDPLLQERLTTIQNSRNTVYIGQGEEPKALAGDQQNSQNGVGTTSFVTINFENSVSLPGVGIAGNDIEADTGAQISHEVFEHAYTHVTGTVDRSPSDSIYGRNVAEDRAVETENIYRRALKQPIRGRYQVCCR